VVVRDRFRGEPRSLLQLAGLQALRAEAAAQPHAARPRRRALRARGRLDAPAARPRARNRGHRGDRERLPQREDACGV